MKISINGVPISFELEHEKNVGEVMDGIQAWLAGTSHTVESAQADGDPLELDGSSWRAREITGTEHLEITARSLYQERIEGLETIMAYLTLLRRVLREGSSSQVAAALEEISHVEAGINAFTPDLAGLITEPLEALEVDDHPSRERLALRCDELVIILESRQQELLDPERSMALTLAVMKEMIPRFREVPQQVQSGEERAAMNTVVQFTEGATRLLRILPHIMGTHGHLESLPVDGKALPDALDEIHHLLQELEQAFQNSDFVLVGDLMEYEMAPRFTAVVDTVATALETHQ